MFHFTPEQCTIIKFKLLDLFFINLLFVDNLPGIKIVLDEFLYPSELDVLKHKFKHAFILVYIEQHCVKLSILDADLLSAFWNCS